MARDEYRYVFSFKVFCYHWLEPNYRKQQTYINKLLLIFGAVHAVYSCVEFLLANLTFSRVPVSFFHEKTSVTNRLKNYVREFGANTFLQLTRVCYCVKFVVYIFVLF